MTYTDEYKLLKEYVENRNMIIKAHGKTSDKTQNGLNLLKNEYAKLIKIVRTANEEPSKKLKLLKQRLEDTYSLLVVWTKYVEIVYMPESEIAMLEQVEGTDMKLESASFGAK